MIRVALITRSTIFTASGGDTVQITETAAWLNRQGVVAEVLLTDQKINYDAYDLLHFFNLIRPADILRHTKNTNKPFVVSPILVDYSEYDGKHREGVAGKLFRLLSGNTIEYAKTIARWLTRKDKFPGAKYILQGHTHSIKFILRRAVFLLPNSDRELKKIRQQYPNNIPFSVVPNGINPDVFKAFSVKQQRDSKLVLCVGRIEGIKNQLTLIKALNNSDFSLILIGAHAPNQLSYYNECRRAAAQNIQFINHIPQHELANYYRKAKVHVLPSWFETCGLSSLEAMAMGCNVVVTDKGYVRDYFNEYAFYCDPSSVSSVQNAVEQASAAVVNPSAAEMVRKLYTWQEAAKKTFDVYKTVLQK